MNLDKLTLTYRPFNRKSDAVLKDFLIDEYGHLSYTYHRLEDGQKRVMVIQDELLSYAVLANVICMKSDQINIARLLAISEELK